MARGQDAPTKTGGGIDPYVQSSMQQNKQLAGNRLIAAMQESGATQRAGMAANTQVQTEGMRNQTSLQMQAAQSATDDKRAAEAERGRREDMEFNEKLTEAGQLFETKRDALRREHEVLLSQNMTAEAEKVRQQSRELALIDMEMERDAADRTANTSLSIAKMMIKGDAQKEKMITTLVNEDKRAIQDQGAHAKVIEDSTRRIKLDKRMDLPTVGEIATKAIPAGAPMGFSSGFTLIPTGIKPGTQADPMGVMQDQLIKYNPNLEVANLSPNSIHKLEQQILEKKVTPEDIRSTFGVISGMKEVLTEKAAGASKTESDFWRKKLQQVEEMEESLISLKNSKRQVKDSKSETVGATIRYALGAVYPGLSLGGKVNELRKTGMDWDNVIKEMTKGREPYTPLGVTPDMSPFAVDFRTQVNSIFERKRAE